MPTCICSSMMLEHPARADAWAHATYVRTYGLTQRGFSTREISPNASRAGGQTLSAIADLTPPLPTAAPAQVAAARWSAIQYRAAVMAADERGRAARRAGRDASLRAVAGDPS